MAAVYDVDLIIFGAKRCPTCERDLPANSEQFHVDRSQADGLTRECARCRNARDREHATTGSRGRAGANG